MQEYVVLLCIELRSLCATIPGDQYLELVLEMMPKQATVVWMKPVERERAVQIWVAKIPEYILAGCY